MPARRRIIEAWAGGGANLIANQNGGIVIAAVSDHIKFI